MHNPRLTITCELDRERLTSLFSDASVIEDLKVLGTHVTPTLSDPSDERLIVKMLNAASVSGTWGDRALRLEAASGTA